MVPGKYNMVCPQGATFIKQITYSASDVPVNLSGFTARMQIREKHTSTATIISLTSPSNGIILGGVLGTINITISATATSALVAKEYVYDLEIITGTTVTRLIEGKFIVTPEVTR